ncbi:unnamed protein product [Ilex paraguariensis]|uniref:Exocyst complex subunit Exo70 C-terminal domain-containing protein n=1 Tax=Ilex paraguariensis TaxID=185542 RepID=A0ABC8R8R2_9AQUA
MAYASQLSHGGLFCNRVLRSSVKARSLKAQVFGLSIYSDSVLDFPDIKVVFQSKQSESIRVQGAEILSRLAEVTRGTLSEFKNAVLREPSRIPVPGGTIHPLTRAHRLGTAALSAKEQEALPFCAIAYALTGIFGSLICSVPAVRHPRCDALKRDTHMRCPQARHPICNAPKRGDQVAMPKARHPRYDSPQARQPICDAPGATLRQGETHSNCIRSGKNDLSPRMDKSRTVEVSGQPQ